MELSSYLSFKYSVQVIRSDDTTSHQLLGGMEAPSAQYGFWKSMGTRDAVHTIRRAQEYVERSGEKTAFMLLDWGKGFETLCHRKLFTAMQRIGVLKELIDATKALYAQPEFRVVDAHGQSAWQLQQEGIRQGCPLSPYLFVIATTVMFADIRQNAGVDRLPKPGNINTAGILYADDTILITSTSQAMTKYLHQVECISAQYRMRLNRKKCELLCMSCKCTVNF